MIPSMPTTSALAETEARLMEAVAQRDGPAIDRASTHPASTDRADAGSTNGS